MPKPDITLEPSKGVVAQMAARIYAAYIARGAVSEGEESQWMQRSIREAVRIARTVDASIESEDEPGSDRDSTAGENPSPASGSPASEPSSPSSGGEPAKSSAAESAGKAPGGSKFDDLVGEALADESD